VPLASRCSVHCKSDITHKLNRKEASPEDILQTLHDNMASKVASLLEKGRRPLQRVLVIGGMSRNAALLAALRRILQGGVALNRAVGYAFAHSAGRPVVIPPNPELLGALGVALLARQRAGGLLAPEAASQTGAAAGERRAPGPATDLLALAASEITSVGRFTCGACPLHCGIDRFEVAGRRFPFGGRCGLFENVWKRKSPCASWGSEPSTKSWRRGSRRSKRSAALWDL
jgi:hypothetical protein